MQNYKKNMNFETKIALLSLSIEINSHFYYLLSQKVIKQHMII